MIYRLNKNIPVFLLLLHYLYVSFPSFKDISFNNYNTNCRIISEQLMVIYITFKFP
jgi:hypothetical protein